MSKMPSPFLLMRLTTPTPDEISDKYLKIRENMPLPIFNACLELNRSDPRQIGQ